ncbi:IclR family transcriptional regulator [Kribbella sp. NPDC051620]|uniref:IclR family transcriptional regulator n=1 Tax=Kribbella sp. NPDC051620 TaxID=3364120 RepID=UPI0037B63D42
MRISAAERLEGRSVSDRLMLILDTVAGRGGGVGLTRLAALTGISKPTVHRLAGELTRHGLLAQDADGSYRLGLHLFELGQQVPASRRLRDVALPLMSDLLQATQEIVQLGVLDGTDVVYVEKLTGPHSIRAPSAVGSRLPAYRSALGKAILAFSNEERVEAVLRAPMPAVTSATITSPDRLLRELDAVRVHSLAYDRGETHPGIVCVGAPILDQQGVAIAAISITGPPQRLRIQQVAMAVRTAALSISRTLSFPALPTRPAPSK